MDKYSVKLMSRALRDLDGIYDYIANTLLEAGIALNLVDRIESAILSLETMPYRCPERKRGAYANRDTGRSLWKTTPPFFGLMKQRKR